MSCSTRSFIQYLAVLFLLLSGSWYLSANIFPHKADVDVFFGLISETKQVFNVRLFTHLSLGIAILFSARLIGYLLGARITTSNLILACFLGAAMGCFVLGIHLPLVQTTRFWIFESEQNLLQILAKLGRDGESVLYMTMLVFTFFVPVLKFLVLIYQILVKQSSKAHTALAFISRWAMADVLIVAIVVSAMKSTNGVVEISTRSGLGYFAASVILFMIVTAAVSFKTRTRQSRSDVRPANIC